MSTSTSHLGLMAGQQLRSYIVLQDLRIQKCQLLDKGQRDAEAELGGQGLGSQELEDQKPGN